MSGHVYHELYAHLVWHTKNSARLLNTDLESRVHNYLRERCRVLGGVRCCAVGGTDNHIHIAIGYEPRWSVSDIVRNLKGACAHDINEQFRRKVVEWQRSFGVVSFGMRNLPTVVEYIENQKQHHACGQVHARLERIGFDESGDEGFSASADGQQEDGDV
jgi:putative transposase